MASRMKYWLGAVILGLGLVSVWRLPPEARPPKDMIVRTGEAIHLSQVEQEYNQTAERLLRTAWSDSLAPLVLANEDRGVSLLVPSTLDLDESQVSALETMIRTDIDGVGPRRSDAVFGYVLQPYGQGHEVGMDPMARQRVETFVGQRDGRSYCMQLQIYEPRYLQRTITQMQIRVAHGLRSGLLGVCRPYLEHGAPGSGIQAWLEQGAIRFAMRTGTPEYPIGGRLNFRSWWLFGGWSPDQTSGTLEPDRCWAGYADACRQIFRNPAAMDPILAKEMEIVRRSPATSLGRSSFFTASLRDEQYILYDLEQEFGPEAFARFWASDTDVESAFLSAFGIDVGSWMVERIDSTRGSRRAGPGLPRSASSGSVLAIALLLGLTFLQNRRRRVA